MKEYIEEAGKKGVDILVFPETVLTGYGYLQPSQDPFYQKFGVSMQVYTAETIPGATTNELSKYAKKYNMYIIFGMTEKDEAGTIKDNGVEKVYNSAAILYPNGKIDSYQKIHRAGQENKWSVTGKTPKIIETKWGKIGVDICRDGHFYPELGRYYAAMHAANLPEAEPSAADLAALPDARELALPRAIPVLAAAGEDDESDNDDELTAPPVTRNLAEESGNTRAAEVLTGPRAASQVYVPEYITVHLGAPNDTSARNVTVSFRDYIKNVASSEIYPTWPEAALRANILAQITFAQNRIFTEWYPSRGYNFNITNNTAYDQYFVYGRNIFTNISRLVDELFDQYIRRRGAVNPIFAQYCNGTTVTCGGLSQWGTVALANNGYTPLGILRYYYGDDIVIDTATVQRRITSSYPGAPLTVGSRGEDVRTIRTWLNRIRRNYPAIPAISTTSGDTYNAEMQRSVWAFQRIFNLTPDGIVGPTTWNKIAYIYVAVMRLAELGGEDIPLPAERPSGILRRGSSGETVRLAQYFLRVIALYDDEIPPITIDGSFGPATENAVRAFQKMQGLTVDGIIGPATWNALYERFLGITQTTGLAVTYPGTPLRSGSRGDNVRVVQEYLNTLARAYPLPRVAVDGIYGPATENAVQAFQRLFGLTADGIVGPRTWERLVGTRLLLR